jgi:hypothetical protein
MHIKTANAPKAQNGIDIRITPHLPLEQSS